MKAIYFLILREALAIYTFLHDSTEASSFSRFINNTLKKPIMRTYDLYTLVNFFRQNQANTGNFNSVLEE